MNFLFHASIMVLLSGLQLPTPSASQRSTECSPSEGFFYAPGTGESQCLKAFIVSTNDLRSWPDAQAHCQNLGMTLARPYDAVALARYIYQRYNAWGVWVYAKGNGSKMKWQTNKNWGVPNNSPLWATNEPGDKVTSSYCMMLRSDPDYFKTEPEKPYVSKLCTTKGWIVCEKQI